MATFEMMQRLPALDDDEDIGIEMPHVVARDGERDLKFTGALLASAAPESRNQTRWMELRVYRTRAGQYVLSQVGRSLKDGERDKFEATVLKPQLASGGGFKYSHSEHAFAPAGTLEECLTEYFGFSDVAKDLYRKLEVTTEKLID